ncbi:hypothetical protein NDJ97_12555 [Enterobacter hormaechei subsp. hormaechei]|uniref:hypothetical protein n=1 Tax=Enterobacter hormaechei TaxID=158836 RepID=UPI0021B19048|nr:hypothetical protein [Enterobacter hormaechei]UXA71971.1 hypothetical protein NDJ97_12555 [Enterobacter hormaechei subsp. hormaechei]
MELNVKQHLALFNDGISKIAWGSGNPKIESEIELIKNRLAKLHLVIGQPVACM